jgi:hypothetical protein
MFVSGVFPVYDLKFKVNTAGRSKSAALAVIKDMESFSVSMDGGVEEWTPLDQAGWVRRLMTAKGFTISLAGKRHYGDPGNDYVAGLAWKNGRDCDSEFEIEFPNGDKLTGDCVINVTTPFGGDSTAVDALEFDIMSDGKPIYTSAPGA